MALTYTKHEKISLKDNPSFNEKWLQNIIVEDPSILGLGDLVIKDIEKSLNYGRLDLLLKDDETETRYEVEIQLGRVNESHIIRTLEYWDEERNRYSQYDHIAVIIAEEITSRFFNIISLFNKSIPIIAIQLNALKIDDKIVLNFTKVLDLIQRVDDDTDITDNEPTDRTYWLKNSSESTLQTVDLCVELLKSINTSLSENYLRRYIGIKDQNKSNNMVIFWPKRSFLKIGSKNDDKELWLKKLEDAGITVFKDRKSNRVHLRATKDEIQNNRELFIEFFKDAYKTETAE
jgi:hypothetical protein